MSKTTHELIFVIDRSNSMKGLEEKTAEIVNTFIRKKRLENVDTFVSLILFSEHTETVYYRAPLDKVEEMNIEGYIASGKAAVLDAIGTTAHNAFIVFCNLEDNMRPVKTTYVIITRGEEETSIIYSLNMVKKLIARHTGLFGSEFIFPIAGMDVIEAFEERKVY